MDEINPERSFPKLSPDEEDDEDPGAGEDCSVCRAVCAEEISPEESALSTLVRKVPMGSVPLVARGLDCSTCARYCLAELRSPDLMADSNSEKLLLKVSVLLEVVELVDVELDEVSEKRRGSK
jgi:hypothetical protein